MSEETAQTEQEQSEVNPEANEEKAAAEVAVDPVEEIQDAAPETDETEEPAKTAATDGEAAAEEPAAEESDADKINVLKAELQAVTDKHLRLHAEFENFKRRNAQEMKTRTRFAGQALAMNIITGLDNLERALEQVRDSEDEQVQDFVKGIEMIQEQFYDAFKQNNIERVFPHGELFDPNQHEAVGVIETDEVEPEHIAQVFQAGYIFHDRVIRPAAVQVAKKS